MDVDNLPAFMRDGALFECGHCARCPSNPAMHLKHCKACQSVMYCSKDCQKAAWPTHRDACNFVRDWKRENEPQKFGGYDTPVQLASAVSDWMQKQQQALHVLVRTTVLMSCNIEEAFASPDPPDILVI
ncbi:hypothetical protein PYCCODRAFT_88933 [Trametes coccinea BRFM310]|uniref:MYND-type domain-containing protein n=1 Tax=Trametes coccinea (strain BRFM310) TaxID=1353009 RepID=A0A1Y2I5G8_TRAC3|nr:hypothetical protein PYCCODRAFT_88933 [Trametes coccinea BRFM310]